MEKWDECWAGLNEEPYKTVFGSKDSKPCKARYDKLVDEQSKRMGEAQRDSGAGTPDSDSEDEEEKKTKADLVRGIDEFLLCHNSAFWWCEPAVVIRNR